MKTFRTICLFGICIVIIAMTGTAAEQNFSASLLTAKDVDCKKCHADSPHLIHAQKPVECVNCHGDKSSVSIPVCTKCHDGPIHQVHEGKVKTEVCSYCHTDIENVHNSLISDAVCSHCHKSLTEVHGDDESCVKCHRSPPEIVKPLKLEGTVLICQNCHPQPNIANIHGQDYDKTGCYNCHRGTSKAVGSEVVHTIHGDRVGCQNCHGGQRIFLPECTQCHKINELHSFDKIGRLTAQQGLECSVCHPEISGPSEAAEVKGPETLTHEGEPQGTIETGNLPEQQEEAAETPGFQAALALGMLLAGCIIRKRLGK